jgi:hypothetical protein
MALSGRDRSMAEQIAHHIEISKTLIPKKGREAIK